MQVITIDRWPAEVRSDYRPVLESGNVLFFPQTPFELPEKSKEVLRNLDFSGGAILAAYSRAVVQFTSELLPEYARSWKLDYASFRPVEEQGRHLPLNKRNDLIHTDAFPSRPTYGNLILRVFTNIHPQKTRNWVTTDSFAAVAERYARQAGLEEIASRSTSSSGRRSTRTSRFLQKSARPVVPRPASDQFMLRRPTY